MPKYDYRCASGHVYEKREGFDAPVVQVCPTCNAESRRVLTPPAIVFKGSGWYKNDSRGAAPSESAPASTPATPAASSESSASAAPAASTETKTNGSSPPATT